MNKYLNEKITPYVGTESFKLGMKLEEVRKILKENKIPFNQTEQSNKGTTSAVPWVFITIDSSLTFCFAKDVMYESDLVIDIIDERSYVRKLQIGDTGVRVQTSNISDITLNLAA